MSELRQSIPPVPPMSGDADKAPAPAPAKVTQKVAKPRKTAKVTRPSIVPAKLNAQGKAIRCMVKLGATQCQNPGRHPQGKAFSCSTHALSIAKGRKVTFVSSQKLTYVAPSKVAQK